MKPLHITIGEISYDEYAMMAPITINGKALFIANMFWRNHDERGWLFTVTKLDVYDAAEYGAQIDFQAFTPDPKFKYMDEALKGHFVTMLAKWEHYKRAEDKFLEDFLNCLVEEVKK